MTTFWWRVPSSSLTPTQGETPLAIATQNCGLEDRLEALKDASRRLGFGKPDGRQQVENLPSFNFSDRPIANGWKDVGLHCRLPLRGMLRV